MKKLVLLLFVLFMVAQQGWAQLTEARNIALDKEITLFDNALSRMAYLSQEDEALFAVKQTKIASTYKADAMAFNPAGSYIAVIQDGNKINFWSFTKVDSRNYRFVFEKESAPTAIAFSPNARHFAAATLNGQVNIYSTSSFNKKVKKPIPDRSFQADMAAKQIAISANNYYVATRTDSSVKIYNFESGKLLKNIEATSQISGMCFSPESNEIAITTTGGELFVYATGTWEVTDEYTELDNPISPDYNADGKYIALVTNGTSVKVINLKSHKVVETLEIEENVLKTVFYEQKSTDSSALFCILKNNIKIYDTHSLQPLLGKLVDSRVSDMMKDWSAMGEGESMEEYQIRMSDDNRTKQLQLFSQDAATEIANERVVIENPIVEQYDMEEGTLDVSFGDLGVVALPMSEEDALNFKEDEENLSFANAIYTLNDNDELQLAYVEVLNETTGKTYVYDNLGRTTMNSMAADEDFVPIEIIQQVSEELAVLETLKEEVVEEKKQENLITDNTQIFIGSEVYADRNADGKKIMNYKVDYKYEVKQEYSAKEDFPSGAYDIRKSNAALSMIKIIEQSMDGDMKKYLEECNKVILVVTGSADASPIRGKIAYNGMYGNYEQEPYYLNGELDNITVTKQSGITSNPELGFIRAASVKETILKDVPALNNKNVEIQYNVEVSDEVGGSHRRIKVELIMVDAFPNM